jgi:hypothetical protein
VCEVEKGFPSNNGKEVEIRGKVECYFRHGCVLKELSPGTCKLRNKWPIGLGLLLSRQSEFVVSEFKSCRSRSGVFEALLIGVVESRPGIRIYQNRGLPQGFAGNGYGPFGMYPGQIVVKEVKKFSCEAQ